MKFNTRRLLFLLIIIAICLPLPVLLKALVAVPTLEALIIDYNDFVQEHYPKKV
ncbi:hypothetical protein TEHSL10_19570 [Tetragenococcus halophilus]|nr:hypothetical protein TEHSL10_19570 [Tetragenococcus halophilus]